MIYIPKEGMPQKDKKILEQVKSYEESYFTFDDPIPFCGLKVYPVTVRNYRVFLMASACFTLNKNDDPDGIPKTHLNYLLEKAQDSQDGIFWSLRLSQLLGLIFHVQNGLKCKKCGKFMSIEEYIQKASEQQAKGVNLKKCECGGLYEETFRYGMEGTTKKRKLIVDGHDVLSKDFDLLRKLVMYQNLPDYKDDSWVHPEVRADQEAKRKLMSIRGGGATASLERKIVCVSAKSCYKIDEIYNMPLRKFLVLLDAIDNAMTYEAQLTGRCTGFVSSKKPLDHWIYKKEEGLYDSAQTFEQYTGSIAKANSGL